MDLAIKSPVSFIPRSSSKLPFPHESIKEGRRYGFLDLMSTVRVASSKSINRPKVLDYITERSIIVSDPDPRLQLAVQKGYPPGLWSNTVQVDANTTSFRQSASRDFTYQGR